MVPEGKQLPGRLICRPL